MKFLAPILAMGVLLVLVGCPPPEEPAAPPRDRPAQPSQPQQKQAQPTPDSGTGTGTTEPSQPSQPQISDQQIQQQLQQQIQQDQTLSQAAKQEVRIEVSNGVVTLRGKVDSQEEMRRIEDMVLQAQGVQDVKNELEVKSESPMGPEEPLPEEPAGEPF